MPLHDQVICGDSREVLTTLPDGCIDAVCTDPPYALSSSRNGKTGFMGSHWDVGTVAHDSAFWAEVLRVARPGAFLLAFGGCRTYHRLVCAIEDGGWQPREMLNWVFATGFPKSKSCLKPAHEPIVLAKAPGPLQPLRIDACRVGTAHDMNPRDFDDSRRSAPKFSGILNGGKDGQYHARTGTVPPGRWPANLLLSHVGGPDGCQPAGVRRMPSDKRGRGRPRGTFPHSDDAWGQGHRAYTGAETAGDGTEVQQDYLCHPQCPIRLLDEQAGPRTIGIKKPHHRRHAAKGWSGPYADDQGGPAFRSLTGGDTGACSRFFTVFPPETPDPEDAACAPFFYAPKAPRSERRLPDGTPTGHPTQKPLLLCQWLVTLCCPPGGTCLDPFAGVASVGVGALRAGCSYIGIEQDERYAAAGRARLAAERERQSGPLFVTAEKDA